MLERRSQRRARARDVRTARVSAIRTALAADVWTACSAMLDEGGRRAARAPDVRTARISAMIFSALILFSAACAGSPWISVTSGPPPSDGAWSSITPTRVWMVPQHSVRLNDRVANAAIDRGGFYLTVRAVADERVLSIALEWSDATE